MVVLAYLVSTEDKIVNISLGFRLRGRVDVLQKLQVCYESLQARDGCQDNMSIETKGESCTGQGVWSEYSAEKNCHSGQEYKKFWALK